MVRRAGVDPALRGWLVRADFRYRTAALLWSGCLAPRQWVRRALDDGATPRQPFLFLERLHLTFGG